MKNKLIYPLLLAIFFTLLFLSCEKENLREEEELLLEQYIKDNNITVEPKASGLYYIETKAGTGTTPRLGMYVKVKYTGKLLKDGTVFDTTDGKTTIPVFVLGNLIQGWNEGLTYMKVGGKARLIIPSSIGYGSQGSSGSIPAYATLIFDIELIDTYN